MDAPSNASRFLNGSVHVVGCCRLSGLLVRSLRTRWPVWRCADRVHTATASLKLYVNYWFSRPGLVDHLPLPVLRPAHIPDSFPPFARVKRWREPGRSPSSSPAPPRRASSACGLASRPARGSAVSPRRTACRTTVMAPVIKSRPRSRWPLFDILPSLGLPPVVCCRGTRPNQAAKSRPRRKLSIGGAKACSAIAVTGPTLGDRHEPGCLIVLACAGSEFLLQAIDLRIENTNLLKQKAAQRADQLR